MLRLASWLVLWLFPSGWVMAQILPQHIFRPPINIPLSLTGNFGELRATHFHAGLDFRTQKTTGLPVLASAEGYISRIIVATYGYGKAVYINHPHGYTTVYAHLERFAPRLDSLVRQFQYQNRFYEIDVNLPADFLPVRVGEVIGYSGNSGSSTGPHLHFEIRNTHTDEALNPLLFGFPISDHRPPVFVRAKLLPAGPGSWVNGRNSSVSFSTDRLSAYQYRLRRGLVPEAGGRVALAFEVFDQEDGGVSKNAVYSLRVFLDDSLVYAVRFDRFSFEESPRIGAHVDPEERTKGQSLHLCRVLPNDDNQIFQTPPGSGYLDLKPGRLHSVRVEASDIQGNTAVLNFKIKGGVARPTTVDGVPPGTVKIIDWRKPATFQSETMRLHFPENAVLDTLYLFVAKGDRLNAFGYPDYTIGPPQTPLRKKYTLGIRYRESSIPPERFCIVHGNRFLKTRFEDGFLTTVTDRFGEFTVKADTTRPEVRFLFASCQDLSGIPKIQIRVHDAESGLRFWYAELNGQFLLFEYEHKERLMTADMPFLPQGDHVLDFWVMDNAGNIAYAREYFRTGIRDFKN
jgi:hypothetical protein